MNGVVEGSLIIKQVGKQIGNSYSSRHKSNGCIMDFMVYEQKKMMSKQFLKQPSYGWQLS